MDRWLSSTARDLSPQARFLLVFLAVCGLFAVAAPAVEPLQAASASLLAALVVALFGAGASLYPGAVVVFGDGAFSYVVGPECTGLAFMMLGVAGVVAYPNVRWSRRVVGIAGAILFIFFVNFVRLVSLGWLGWKGGAAAFEAAHLYWWSAVAFATVALAWWAWARWASRSETHSRASRLKSRWQAVFLFAGVLLAFWSVGHFAGGAEGYARLLMPITVQLADPILGVHVAVDPNYAAIHGWDLYAVLAGSVALVLATPTAPWTRRAAAGLAAAAYVSASIVSGIIILWKIRQLTGEGASAAVSGGIFLFQAGGFLAAWWMWAPLKNKNR